MAVRKVLNTTKFSASVAMKTLTPTPKQIVESIVPVTTEALKAFTLVLDERFSYMTKDECGIALQYWKQKG